MKILLRALIGAGLRRDASRRRLADLEKQPKAVRHTRRLAGRH